MYSPVVRNLLWHLTLEISEASIVPDAFGIELGEILLDDSRGSTEAEDNEGRELLHAGGQFEHKNGVLGLERGEKRQCL